MSNSNTFANFVRNSNFYVAISEEGVLWSAPFEDDKHYVLIATSPGYIKAILDLSDTQRAEDHEFVSVPFKEIPNLFKDFNDIHGYIILDDCFSTLVVDKSLNPIN